MDHKGQFFLNLSNPMMPLPGRNLANVTSNFSTISYECHRQFVIRRTWPQIPGPLTPSLLIVVWVKLLLCLMRRFVAPIHVVTWDWNSEQRSPIVLLAFSRT